MTTAALPANTAPAPLARTVRLRIWPAIPLLLYMLGATLAKPLVQEITFQIVLLLTLGPMVCAALLIVWWLFASRARWTDRLLGLVGIVVLTVAGMLLGDPTIRPVPVPAVSPLMVGAIGAFAAGAVVFSFWGSRPALVAGLVGFALTMGYWDSLQFDGVWGDFKSATHWRWEKSAEDEFLASMPSKSAASSPGNSEPLGKVEWSQFRGPNRDSSVPGVALSSDWKTRPPKQIWKHKVGPGWSSFSVAGNRLFTQEQRGEKEVVVCYDANTGEERWAHDSQARFAEAMGGVGPRATPTLSGGMLYAQGATGLLQCLNPLTGEMKWERDIMKDANRPTLPVWGFAASPLIVGDTVIAYAGADGDFGLLAYDVKTGDPKWHAAAGKDTYSSPQLAKLAGREVVLLLDDVGLTAVDAQTGKPAWNYEWNNKHYRVIQPLLVGGSSVLLGNGLGGEQLGTRRIDVSADKGDTVKIADRWTTTDMKPAFNDYVAFNGYLYGLDHNILCCVDLESGTKKWKNGRYGNGQILLLPDAGQLLVLSESGDLVLVRANPAKFEEVARHKVLEGKTWNHPVLVKDRVYVRNAEEAACFEVPLESQSAGEPKKAAPKEL
jgi:outer membrane protein assembly factor BamB